MSDKTPRQRFVEAARNLWVFIDGIPENVARQELSADLMVAAEAFADQSCKMRTEVEGWSHFDGKPMRLHDHEACRASLRAEIRGHHE